MLCPIHKDRANMTPPRQKQNPEFLTEIEKKKVNPSDWYDQCILESPTENRDVTQTNNETFQLLVGS